MNVICNSLLRLTGDQYRAKEGEPFGQPGFLLAVGLGLGLGSRIDHAELAKGNFTTTMGQFAFQAAKVLLLKLYADNSTTFLTGITLNRSKKRFRISRSLTLHSGSQTASSSRRCFLRYSTRLTRTKPNTRRCRSHQISSQPR